MWCQWLSWIRMYPFAFFWLNNILCRLNWLFDDAGGYYCYVDSLYIRHPAWTLYVTRKIVGCACAGNAWNVLRPPTSKKPASWNSRHHHGTYVTHVPWPWCMSGSLTYGNAKGPLRVVKNRNLLSHLDDLKRKRISSGWHSNIAVTHPGEILTYVKSSVWYNMEGYVIRMT